MEWTLYQNFEGEDEACFVLKQELNKGGKRQKISFSEFTII
jgi:hypothetical protein